MSAQQPLKNWKAAAFAAISKYYTVESEKASYEERLEQAKRECERAGVSFRYGSPNVDHVQDAFSCPCGAVVVFDYGQARPTSPPFHCRHCIEKTQAAVEQDQNEEAVRARVEKPSEVPLPAPAPKPAVEDIPF